MKYTSLIWAVIGSVIINAAESQSSRSKNDKYGSCHSPFGGCPMPYCTETNACQVRDPS
jgi:hypothetical protein